MVVWVTLGALAIVLAVWAIFTFNLLVRRRNQVAEGWAQIEAELQRRGELVPELLAAVQGYADFERDVIGRVAETRARAVAAAGPDERAQADGELTGALRSLFVVAEAYPELRTGEQMLALQEQLAHTEDRIAYARGYYNAVVQRYEELRLGFPSRLVAGAFRFPRRALFEADLQSIPRPGGEAGDGTS